MNNAPKQFKRGTIGYAANKLAKKYGNYSQGILILMFALEEALSEEGDHFNISIGNSRKYQRILAEEQATFDRIKEDLSTNDFYSKRLAQGHKFDGRDIEEPASPLNPLLDLDNHACFKHGGAR